MTHILKKLSVLVIGLFAVTLMAGGTAHAATTNGRIIDDAVFDASGSMSAADIQAFLNQFPNSCLKNYTDSMPSSDPTQAYFSYSGTGSVAQIIRRVADVYGVNPRVMLTKLEQEENLVTGNAGCAQWRYASAVGFHCFDGANPRTTVFNGTTIQTCVDRDENMGVARQLTKGMWTLKWGKERANGNLAWMVPDDASITYYGPMTQGTRKRCGNCAAVYYDGYWKGVYLETGATASLYNYTPYLGQAFGSIWEGWWGAGTTYAANYTFSFVGQSSFPTIQQGQSATAYFLLRNTGNRNWYPSPAPGGERPIHLATAGPLNRASEFGQAWLGTQNRPTTTFAAVYESDGVTLAANQGVATQNQVVKFAFTYQTRADTLPGVYREGFILVNEGNTFLNDIGLYQNVTVTETPATSPRVVYRHYSPTRRAHFYTVDANESRAIRSQGWNYEGIGFQASVTANSRPVYRHYSPTRGAHFFTTNLAESQAIRSQGWNYEGVAFYTNEATGAPVYRHYNPSVGRHFFTTSLAESQIIRTQGWGYEGIAFYGF